MNIFQLLKASLMEPKKQAAVRILSIGKLLRFVFLFILLLTIVAFTEFVIGLNRVSGDLEGLLVYIEEIEWLLYPLAFVLLFVSTTFYHFIKISLFAWIGMGMLNVMKRRGEYRHLWRTAALSITFPTILSFAIGFVVENEWLPLLVSMLTLVYLYLAIKYYPKKPPVQS